MRDEHEVDLPRRAGRLQHRERLHLREVVERRGRLFDEQDRGAAREGQRERDPLGLTAAELVGILRSSSGRRPTSSSWPAPVPLTPALPGPLPSRAHPGAARSSPGRSVLTLAPKFPLQNS
jgi:hypothetical protein